MKIRRSARPLYLAASLAVLAPWLHPATAQLLGPVFQVNSYTTSYQRTPAVAADSSGKFIVTWESWVQDGSQEGVFGQRFNSLGAKVGSEFQVNSYTTNGQRFPAVAADSSGKSVVAWESFGQDGSTWGVFGQWFDSGGSPVGSELQINSYTTNEQRNAAVAAVGLGSFIVVWDSYLQDGSAGGVFGQRYDSVGNPEGSEFRVSSYTTGEQDFPAVAATSSGDFVVVWESEGQDGSSLGVFGQQFNSLGSPVGDEFRVNSYTTGDQRFPSVAADSSGNFVVVWHSVGQDGSSYGVFGQRFSSAGGAVGSEFQVNSYTTGSQASQKVAAESSGGFVVVWDSYGQDGAIHGVFGRRFNSVGSAVGSEFQVNSYTTNDQAVPSVAADGAGNFVMAWQSDWQDDSNHGVFGRQMTVSIFADGFDLGDACAWSAAVGGGC